MKSAEPTVSAGRSAVGAVPTAAVESTIARVVSVVPAGPVVSTIAGSDVSVGVGSVPAGSVPTGGSVVPAAAPP